MCVCVCVCRVLQTDILDINDIFRDLGTMVHDQGELVGKALSSIVQSCIEKAKSMSANEAVGWK